MIIIFTLCFLFPSLICRADAVEVVAPTVPDSGQALMPKDYETLGDALEEIVRNAILQLHPNFEEARRICLVLVGVSMLVSLLKNCCGKAGQLTELIGVTYAVASMLYSSRSMIVLASDTIQEMFDYGKLLLPVMTAAMAAQGGVTESATLYMGTAVMDAVLSGVISSVFVPGVYFFLMLSAAWCATGDVFLKNLKEMIKNAISWCLKILLTFYTTYMSVTGVVSGTTDAAALKAAKVTISSAVPVVGGILSDASETVLVSVGLMRNAAGIYGLLAVIVLFISPFLEIGIHYLILKSAGFVCCIFDSEKIYMLTDSFSAAMGLLLAMTGSVCLMLLISTVCFMRGVG